MKKFLTITGIILIAISLYYFIRLANLLLNSYELTGYGYGLLAGKVIILLAGILLLYFGIKMKKS